MSQGVAQIVFEPSGVEKSSPIKQMKVICENVSFQPTVEEGRSKSFPCKIVDACSIVSRIEARVKAGKYICRHQKGSVEGCTILRRERRRYCCGGVAGEEAYQAIDLCVRPMATSDD